MKNKIRKLKTKKCAIGREAFQPIRPFQKTCFEHAGEWIILQRAKKWKKEGKIIKAKLKTTASHLQDLQKLFNKWVVLRDKLLPCISCGVESGVRFSCGHYWTQGSYPNLRIDPDNSHKQCWFNCNKNKRGNLAEYMPNLIKKIGQKRVDALYARRSTPLKLNIPEIQDLKTHYRKLIKHLTTKHK